ncbi:acyl-CoA dehydrogenase family protein (plasmid) [Microvirga sp. RSM25]|uniref:acyl-CoA dehydrogenase family protein n=1 Tax=Microvirga sp. RSM25 TaxID=3273802 RepID=UPI00384C7B19
MSIASTISRDHRVVQPAGGRLISPDFETHPDVVQFLEHLRAGAAERERTRTLPKAGARALADLGLGAVRVPKACGGHGWRLEDLLRFIYTLGFADANLAHALRNHYLNVEHFLHAADASETETKVRQIVEGALIGGANSERNETQMGAIGTTILPDGDRYVLNGRKFYSTGAIFADYLAVSATSIEGKRRWLHIPADREGITLVDDWDGFGQRLTGSGTTSFENVVVYPDEISAEDLSTGDMSPKQSAFAQLYMTTVAAGIVGDIAQDGVDLLRARKRTYQHASAQVPQEDPLLLEQIGYLSSYAYAAKAIVTAAAPSVARVGHVFHDGGDFHAAYQIGALEAGHAKLAVDEIAFKAGALLFDVGGASATSTSLGLDRHWRNARTIASHNPRVFKARSIGDHLVNAAALPKFFF